MVLFGLWKHQRRLLPIIASAAAALIVWKLVPGVWYIFAGGLAGTSAAILTAGRAAMRLDPVALLTFLGMLAVTYGARIGGYWFVRRYPVGPRLKAGLEAVPLAVLTAIIAPMVLATGPAESLAAVATLLLAWRFPVLVAVLGGIITVVLLRLVVG